MILNKENKLHSLKIILLPEKLCKTLRKATVTFIIINKLIKIINEHLKDFIKNDFDRDFSKLLI